MWLEGQYTGDKGKLHGVVLGWAVAFIEESLMTAAD